MTEHPNLTWFRALCEAEPAVVDDLRDAVAPDVVVHSFGESRLAGDSVGWEEFQAHVEALRRDVADAVAHRAVGYYADDHWTMVSWIITLTRGERTLEMPAIGVWRLDEDRRLAEHWELLRDQRAWDAFVG